MGGRAEAGRVAQGSARWATASGARTPCRGLRHRHGDVGAAGDGGRRVLADLAELDACVAGAGPVRYRVAAGAQERAVRAAV